MNTCEELTKWLANKNVNFAQCIRAKQSDKHTEGTCIIAQKDFKYNQDMLSLPEFFLVNFYKAFGNEELNEFFNWYNGTKTSNQYHLTRLDALYMLLLKEQSNDKSEYYPFVNSIPRAYTTPEHFDKNLIELLPDYIRSNVEKIIEKIKLRYNVILNATNAYNLANNKCLLDNLTFDLFKWAFTSVNTRCFHLDEKDLYDRNQLAHINSLFGRLNRGSHIKADELAETNNSLCCLIPYLDFMNHSFTDANAYAFFDRKTKSYRVRTVDCPTDKCASDVCIRNGEQIYFTYGPHSNKTLFFEYGFVLDNNPYDCLEFGKNDFLWLFSNWPNPSDRLDELWSLLAKSNLTADCLSCTLNDGPSYALLKSLDCVVQLEKKSDNFDFDEKTFYEIGYPDEIRSLFDNLLRTYQHDLLKSLNNIKSLRSTSSQEQNSEHLDLCLRFCAMQLDIVENNLKIANGLGWHCLF